MSMSKGLIIGIVCACVAAACIIGAVLIIGSSAPASSQTAAQSALPTFAPTSSAATAQAAGTQATPSPYSSSAVQTSPSASAKTELTALQKEGLALLSGNWYSNDPISIKVLFTSINMPAEFHAECGNELTAHVWGTVRDIPTISEPIVFDDTVAWDYKGNNQFVGIGYDGSTLDFTCDGSKVTIIVNPYRYGLTDNSIADINIPITLKRV